jgi:hypothetical protein
VCNKVYLFAQHKYENGRDFGTIENTDIGQETGGEKGLCKKVYLFAQGMK